MLLALTNEGVVARGSLGGKETDYMGCYKR